MVLAGGEVRRLVDADILERLEAANWEHMALALTDYALFKVRRLKWRTGDKESLPKGMTAEDLACEAIEKVWSGERQWNPTESPDLLAFLKSVVDSLVSHLVLSADHLYVQRMPETSDGREIEELLKVADPSSDTAQDIVTVQHDPECLVISRMTAERFVGALFEEIAGDGELEGMVTALMGGAVKPKEIAKEMGIEVERVYKLRERLDRAVMRVEKRLPN